MTIPPRLIGRKEAAAYCGISPTCFSMWVARGIMPPTLPGTRRWDRRAINGYDSPRFGLDAKSENILVTMSLYPDLDTIDQLRGAGPVMMGRLVAKKLVVCENTGKEIRYKSPKRDTTRLIGSVRSGEGKAVQPISVSHASSSCRE